VYGLDVVVVVVVVVIVIKFCVDIVLSSTFDVLASNLHVDLGYYCNVPPVSCIVVVAFGVYFVGFVVARAASGVVVCLEWGDVSFLGTIQKTCLAFP
jgi:hypothetical protein